MVHHHQPMSSPVSPDRPPAWLLSFLVALLTAAGGFLGAAPAMAASMVHTYNAPASAYDTVAYTYDAPAHLSTPDTVATDTRGSPSGPRAVSWGKCVFIDGFVLAANTGAGVVESSVARTLTAAEQRSVASLQRQVAAHTEKLGAYRASPDAFDNLGYLERAASPEIRRRIIDGRINHLETEMRGFQDQIDKILGGS